MNVRSGPCAAPPPPFRTWVGTRNVWHACLPLLLLAWLALACNPSHPDVPPSTAPSLFALEGVDRRAAESPSLVVGGEAALPLDRVGGAVFFGDGVAIANGGTNEIIVVDSLGETVASWGRTGLGPGEYRWLAGIARNGEGLLLWDESLRRLTRLDREGRTLGSAQVTPPQWGRVRLVGALGERALLQIWFQGFRGEGMAGPTLVRHPEEFLMVSLSDGAVLSRKSLLGEEQWARREATEGPHGGIPVLFGRTASAAVAGGRAFIGDTDSLSLWSVDDGGEELGLVFPLDRTPVRPEWVSAARDTLRARFDATQPGELFLADGRNFLMAGAEFRRGLLQDLPVRETLPAFSSMLGGADGSLWIRGYPHPLQEEVVWVSFDESLQPLGKVALPVSFRVLDIAPDRVLVLERGPFDEHLVAVYPIEQR